MYIRSHALIVPDDSEVHRSFQKGRTVVWNFLHVTFLENFCTPASRCVPLFERDLLPPLTEYLKVFTLMMETVGTCETLVLYVHTRLHCVILKDG
jgi:hypothetical protein